MRDLLQAAAEASFRNSVLLILLAVIAAFSMGTLVLSVYAIALRERHRAREHRRERLAQKWQGPVLLAVADPDQMPGVDALVEKQNRLRFVGFVLEYARRVRGEERGVLRSLARPHLSLVAKRADSRREEVRARAIQTLGTIGLPDHAARVIAALDDRSPLVAMVAARALARAETPQYAPDVLAHLERFKGWDRRFLASMLAAMGPDVSGTLRWGLGDHGVEPWTRALLAEASYLQGDFLAGDVAARVLSETEDTELRASVLRLLSGVGRPEHAPAVRELCASPNPVIRAQALRALGTVGGQEDLQILLSAMADSYPWAALHAARGAAVSGGTQALARLAASDDPRAPLARQVLAEGSDA
jgi:hypothetical protein